MASTGVTATQETAFRSGALNGKQLSPLEREEIMKPFLPSDPVSHSRTSSQSNAKRPRLRTSIANKARHGPVKSFLHFVAYQTISLIFSVYFRFRRAWHLVSYKVRGVMAHHHHTPEWIVNDVKNLRQLPEHVSVLLDYHENDEDQGTAGLEGLLNDVCKIAAWSAAAGIPLLSVYERSGMATDSSAMDCMLTISRCTQELSKTDLRGHLPDSRNVLRAPPLSHRNHQVPPHALVLAAYHTRK